MSLHRFAPPSWAHPLGTDQLGPCARRWRKRVARIWDAGNGSDTKMAGGPPQPMQADSFPVRPSGIGAMLVSSRSLAEYRAMFALSNGDLAKRILDCPAAQRASPPRSMPAAGTSQPATWSMPRDLFRRP